MEEAIEEFGNRLKRGGVGLFYYAGHGVQVSGVNYLLPVGARINKESDVRFQAVDAGRVLAEMENANNGLNIVILDACRDNPFGKTFRSASRGLAIVSSAPVGTFISYSTGAGQVARDGTERNSPYTSALLQYMQEPGVPITNVFIKVRQKLRKETGQVPWELSSLEGEFYFRPGLARESATTVPLLPSPVRETTEVAMGSRPSISGASEIGRDGRFIAYDNGTVLDTKTNLMWAAKDNGSDINWSNAKSYCENYRGGGYTDWRMPTQDELAELYDDAGYDVHLTELINLTRASAWASDTRGSEAAFFDFFYGLRRWLLRSDVSGSRALPVRSGK